MVANTLYLYTVVVQ